MNNFNLVSLIGRAGNTPEVKYINGDKIKTTFRLAVRRPLKNKQGNEVTDWFTITSWGKTAENVGELVTKGRLVSVLGSIEIHSWTTDTGEQRSRPEIYMSTFQLLDKKTNGENLPTDSKAPGQVNENEEDELDEIPF